MSVAVVPAALKPSAYIGARFSPGKVTLPLSNSLPYANFEHVRGVPATGDQEGYSVNRLHILNAILERYARLSVARSDNTYAAAGTGETGRSSSGGRADAGPSNADIARADAGPSNADIARADAGPSDADIARADAGPSDADIARAAEALHQAARRSVYGVSYGTGLFETGVGVSVTG